MGSVAAVVNEVLPAQAIVSNMVNDAARILQNNAKLVKVSPKL